jgi:hypothetical protein
MNLDLIEKKTNALVTAIDTTDIRFNFIRNTIQKDLDVFYWCNSVVEIFGDFHVYSDGTFELNCFDQSLSLLIRREIDYTEDSLETVLTSKCTEYVFDHLMFKKLSLKVDTKKLSDKFTRYLFEASEVFLDTKETQKQKLLDDLSKKYFPGFKPQIWKTLNPNFWNSKRN